MPPRQKQLARVDPGQLVEQALGRGRLGGAKIARGHVDEGQAESVAAFARHRCDVVGRTRFQRFLVENHPRRDDANHAALDQALDQLGVFQLLADGHATAQLGETGDVAARRVVGHPAHGHRILFALVAGGLREREHAGRVDRVLVEHLVEIPEAKKHDRVGNLRLDLEVLAHERGRGLVSRTGTRRRIRRRLDRFGAAVPLAAHVTSLRPGERLFLGGRGRRSSRLSRGLGRRPAGRAALNLLSLDPRLVLLLAYALAHLLGTAIVVLSHAGATIGKQAPYVKRARACGRTSQEWWPQW